MKALTILFTIIGSVIAYVVGAVFGLARRALLWGVSGFAATYGVIQAVRYFHLLP